MKFEEWLKLSMPHYPNNSHTVFPNWAMEAAFKAGRESLADELEDILVSKQGDMESYGCEVMRKLTSHSY